MTVHEEVDDVTALSRFIIALERVNRAPAATSSAKRLPRAHSKEE